MPRTEAQKRATKKYFQEKTKRIEVRFFPADMELYEWAKSKGNAAGYIKELIRRDLESGGDVTKM